LKDARALKAVKKMDRMLEAFFLANVSFIRHVLDSLKAKQLIDIRQEIPDEELLAIINDIMLIEAPKEMFNVPDLEMVDDDVEGIETKILKAIELCEEENIRVTAKEITARTGIPKSTVGRYIKRLK